MIGGAGLVKEIVEEAKGKGYFDELRSETLQAIDAQGQCDSLKQKVESMVMKDMRYERWQESQTYKKRLRDRQRDRIQRTNDLDRDIERILDKVLSQDEILDKVKQKIGLMVNEKLGINPGESVEEEGVEWQGEEMMDIESDQELPQESADQPEEPAASSSGTVAIASSSSSSHIESNANPNQSTTAQSKPEPAQISSTTAANDESPPSKSTGTPPPCQSENKESDHQPPSDEKANPDQSQSSLESNPVNAS